MDVPETADEAADLLGSFHELSHCGTILRTPHNNCLHLFHDDCLRVRCLQMTILDLVVEVELRMQPRFQFALLVDC